MDNDGKVEVQEFIHFWSDSNDFWDWTEEKREIAKDKLAVRKPVLGLYPTRTKWNVMIIIMVKLTIIFPIALELYQAL